MALAKERSMSHDSLMMNSLNHLSPQSPYSSPEEFEKTASFDQDKVPDRTALRAANNQAEDGQSVINFSSFLTNSDQSLLSFDPKEELYVTSDQNYQWNHQNSRFSADYSCFQTASDYSSSVSNCANKAKQSASGSDGSYAWIYSESAMASDHSLGESTTQESTAFNKRLNMGESTQAAKKQCSSSHSATNSKKQKIEKPSVSKDPQSIAAKNRRERISERLKVLQELVPNGSKVDLVTMLEKAISYVKFLQLQVKVLATDEFWPVQGGKAPDITQVREAIDAILSSSQKDKKSSSN